MENDPEKWHEQTWVIPFRMNVTRRGETWYLEDETGAFRTPVEANVGELFVLIVDRIHKQEREERQ